MLNFSYFKFTEKTLTYSSNIFDGFKLLLKQICVMYIP